MDGKMTFRPLHNGTYAVVRFEKAVIISRVFLLLVHFVTVAVMSVDGLSRDCNSMGVVIVTSTSPGDGVREYCDEIKG
jgi:hypothetical protein